MKFENTKWAKRLTELSELEDGWYDGEGKAISEEAMNTADKILHTLNIEGTLSIPGIFPSLEEGDGLGLEWSDYKQLRKTGDFHQISCYLTNDCSNYDIFILERRDTSKEISVNNLKDTSLETTSYEEAITFLRENLERLGFYSS